MPTETAVANQFQLEILGPGECYILLNGAGDKKTYLGNPGSDCFTFQSFAQIAIKGFGGDDTLKVINYSTAYKSVLKGGAGNDYLQFEGSAFGALIGGGGKDKLVGGKRDDTLSGGKDRDDISGGRGDDKLLGGGGNDTLKGGAGNDVLRGGKGDDTLAGGGGADLFIFNRGDGSDTINNFNTAQDFIQIGRGASEFADLTITQSGSDVEVTFANVSITLDGIVVADVTSDLFLF